MNISIRIIACAFSFSLAYLLVSFSNGVGESSIAKVGVFIVLGFLSQLGLFLSTYPISKKKFRWLIALMMLPSFVLLLGSILDSSFINRLTGNPVQITFSIACVIGIVVYIYSYKTVVK
jgi:hypothetical protein